MAINSMEATPTTSPRPQDGAVVDEQLVCALTGKPIRAEDAYWAPPLVTARELVATVLGNMFRSPGNLGYILFAEQPNVPYAEDAREQLAARRNAEQLKLLVGLLLLVALIATPILLLTIG
jgi:hypothetical protein